MKKNDREKRKSLIFLCDEHRRPIEQHYFLDEQEEDERWGVCFGCMKPAFGRLYAFEPRRPRYQRPRDGGGERARAGR